MLRKLVVALSVATTLGLSAGCKDDSNTSMKSVDTKAMYKNQEQYKQSSGAGTATTTTKD